MARVLFYRSDWNGNYERQVADGYGGVGYYRIVQPAKYLKGHEVTVIGAGLKRPPETMEKMWNRIFTDYDVFWTSYFANPQEASAMFYYRDKLRKKVVVDLDDDYLAIETTHPLYDKMKPGKKDRAFVSTILSFADVITVSTEPLKQKINEHMEKVFGLKKKIIVIPNMNDINDWDFEPEPKHDDKIVIGYAGSNSHYQDLKMLAPALAEVMKRHPNVYFESMGAIGKSTIDIFLPFTKKEQLRCDLVPMTWTFKDYCPHLAKQKWDIGIGPLIDSEFTRSKSHIKWLEYSMYKIPMVASRVYPYFMPSFGIDTIKNGETGFLVKPSEWVSTLEELITNKAKRKQIGQNAYDFVKSNWQYDERFSTAMASVIKALE